MIRDPAVAGTFYPGSEEALQGMLERCIEEAEKEDAIGIVVPHAGYIYSGKVAGAVYSRLNFPDTFVVISPNHTGLGSPFSIMSKGAWNLPFGCVNIDSILAEKIFGSQFWNLEIFLDIIISNVLVRKIRRSILRGNSGIIVSLIKGYLSW